MNQLAEDRCLALLQLHWNEKLGVLDTAGIGRSLGDVEKSGDFYASVLGSGLRGWQPLAANELREITARHIDPPIFWLKSLWDYAQSAITSDPDEVTHLFSMMRTAKSDAVRQWMAQPLVELSEREAKIYKWLGFEGLECLIRSGGSVHLRRFISRIASVGKTSRDPAFREASLEILKMLAAQFRVPAIQTAPLRDRLVGVFDQLIQKRLSNALIFSQQEPNRNDYQIENTRKASYAY